MNRAPLYLRTWTLMLSVALSLLLSAGNLFLLAKSKPSRRYGRFDKFHSRLIAVGLRNVSLGSFVSLTVLFGVVFAAIITLVTGIYIFCVFGFLIGIATPILIVNYQYRRLVSLDSNIWPDIVENVISAVRAGMGLPEALCSLSRFGPVRIRQIFCNLENEYGATGNFASAVANAKCALADPKADRILETVQLARSLGGSELIKVLRNLSEYMREDLATRAEIVGRQSWVVNAARIAVAAPWAVLAIMSTRAETVSAYNSQAGVVVIILGALSCAIAYKIMMVVARIPQEERYMG